MKDKQNKNNIKIRTHMNKLITFLSIIIVISTMTSLIVNGFIKKLMVDEIKSSMYKDSMLVAQKADTFFSKAGVIVNQMETNPYIINYVKNIKDRNSIKMDENYKNIIYTLNSVKEKDNNITLVWIAIEKANYIITNNEWDVPDDLVLNLRPWYKEVMNVNGLCYTNPYVDKVTGKKVISIIKPLLDNKDGVLGFFAVDLMIDDLEKMLLSYGIGESGYAILVSNGGDVVYNSRGNKSFNIDIKNIESIIPVVTKNEKDIIEYKYNGDYLYISRLGVISNDWSIISVVPKSDLERNFAYIKYATVMIYGISIFIVYLMIKSIQYLYNLSSKDNLTGAYNRNKFYEILNREVYNTKTKRKNLSVIIYDIDFFKKINDKYGHLNGDIVLKEITSIVTQSIRKSDYMVRWGGEEFLILMPNTDKDGAYIAAEKLRKLIEEYKFSVEGIDKVTCSFGVAKYIYGESIAEFINRADVALYDAKNTGRNKVIAK